VTTPPDQPPIDPYAGGAYRQRHIPAAPFPPPPGYPHTDPNARMYYARMMADQRLINGAAATAMLRNSRATMTSYRRLMPFVIVGIVVIMLGSMAFAFSALPDIPGAPSVNLLPAIGVLAFFAVLIGWVLRRQSRSRKATIDYVDAMIAHQEAFQRAEQAAAHPHNPAAAQAPAAN